MATYEYKARNKFGKLIKGKIDADSPLIVAEKLKSTGLVIVDIATIQASSSRIMSFSLKKVKLVELNMFTRQMVTLLKAGLPLLKALTALQDQVANPLLKDAITHMIIDVQTGVAFSNALANYPNIFSHFYVNMIKIAEATGNLDDTLERLAFLGEKEFEIHEKIKSATRYPMLIIFALGAGFLIVVKFVLPRFSKIFSQFKMNLPLPTKILLGFNTLVVHYWLPLIVGIIILIFAITRFVKTKRGKALVDRVLIRLPIFGDLFLGIAMARFTRTAGSLVASGIPIVQVLTLTGDVVENAEIATVIKKIKAAITEGKKIAEEMKESKLFPPMVLQMVAIGEDTGKLDELLLKTADYYDFQVDYKIRNLTVYIEPLLLLSMGVGVLFIALAMFLPMWNMIYIFKK